MLGSAIAEDRADDGPLDAVDWAAGPLGPPDRWPRALRAAVDICRASAAPVLIWWGPEFVQIYNAAGRTMLGDLGAVGRPVAEACPALWDGLGPSLRQVVDGGGLLRVASKDAPTFVLGPIHAEAGAVAGVVGTLDRAAAAAIRARDARIRGLERQLDERRQAEAALLRSQKNEVVGQLTAGVAHDFNNLLTAILCNLELLAGRLADEGPLKLVQAAVRAAERGARLNEQLLAVARQQQLMPKRVDLNRVIAGLDSLLRSTVGSAIQVRTELAADVWPALVDPNQVELVVLNLGLNARDAMEPGGRLTVATANVTMGAPELPEDPPAGDYVALSVADTGCGIPPDMMGRVLEPFFTTKAAGTSSGLGLSAVSGVARQSGGGLRIESRPGVGTRVTVFLPRAPAPAPPRPTEMAGARLLLVDDDAAVRITTAELLGTEGFLVREADGATAALAALEQGEPIDLMLADFAMPGMNGLELARVVRRRWPRLPVLFATGYADAAVLAAEAGRGRVVKKPYRAAELAARIREVIAAEH